MASTYCNKGHLVTYSNSKPKHCPVCNDNLAPKPVALAYNESEGENHSQHGKKNKHRPPRWREAEDDEIGGGYEGYGEYEFDGITIQREPGERKGKESSFTFEQLRSQGPIERTEGSRSSPQGNNKVATAADIVREMLEHRPQQTS